MIILSEENKDDLEQVNYLNEFLDPEAEFKEVDFLA